MKRLKRSLAAILIAVMLFSTNAYANENEKVSDLIVNVTSDNEGIMPIYTYIDVITAALMIDDNGHCVFSWTVTALGYDIKLEIYLQRSKNQIIWDEIMGSIKTVDQSGGMEYSLDLKPENYYYRAKVVVSVLDGNKNTIETETVYSSTERY